MKRFTAAQARQRFSELLDAAEQGRPVLVERRGVRFIVKAQAPGVPRTRRRKSLIQSLDPAVVAGEWTWASASVAGGLRFVPRRRRR